MALPNAAVGAGSALPMVANDFASAQQPFLPLSQGTFVCNGTAAVTITNAAVTANSNILITLGTVGGTVGALPTVKTITAGTGFTTKGTASDTSTYQYLIIG